MADFTILRTGMTKEQYDRIMSTRTRPLTDPPMRKHIAHKRNVKTREIL